MAFSVGDVVKVKTAPPGTPLGRICKIILVTNSAKVQVSETECVPVDLDDLELATGDAPACTEDCKE